MKRPQLQSGSVFHMVNIQHKIQPAVFTRKKQYPMMSIPLTHSTALRQDSTTKKNKRPLLYHYLVLG